MLNIENTSINTQSVLRKIIDIFKIKRHHKADVNIMKLIEQLRSQGLSVKTISRLTGIPSKWID